jgi:hypothetical protein
MSDMTSLMASVSLLARIRAMNGVVDASKWEGGEIEAAQIDGDFVVGARMTAKIKGYPRLSSTVTHIDPPRLWVGVAKRPGVTKTLEPVIEPVDVGVLVIERVVMRGPLSGLAARLLGNRLDSVLNHHQRASRTHGRGQFVEQDDAAARRGSTLEPLIGSAVVASSNRRENDCSTACLTLAPLTRETSR